MTWFYYFIYYCGEVLVTWQPKLCFLHNMSVVQKLFTKDHCKEPHGKIRKDTALTHPSTTPSPPALDSEDRAHIIGSETPLSDPHRWTHPSVCHVGVS